MTSRKTLLWSVGMRVRYKKEQGWHDGREGVVIELYRAPGQTGRQCLRVRLDELPDEPSKIISYHRDFFEPV